MSARKILDPPLCSLFEWIAQRSPDFWFPANLPTKLKVQELRKRVIHKKKPSDSVSAPDKVAACSNKQTPFGLKGTQGDLRMFGVGRYLASP